MQGAKLATTNKPGYTYARNWASYCEGRASYTWRNLNRQLMKSAALSIWANRYIKVQHFESRPLKSQARPMEPHTTRISYQKSATPGPATNQVLLTNRQSVLTGTTCLNDRYRIFCELFRYCLNYLEAVRDQWYWLQRPGPNYFGNYLMNYFKQDTWFLLENRWTVTFYFAWDN